MRLLLDTHILLWLMDDSPRLSQEARTQIVNAAEVFASSVSVWEIAIKSRLGKLEVDAEMLAAKVEAAGLKELYVTNRHAAATSKLPLIHGDPFDRLLIGQAVVEPMRLLTADAKLTAYSELVIAV